MEMLARDAGDDDNVEVSTNFDRGQVREGRGKGWEGPISVENGASEVEGRD
jgi:hypothetical protein